MELLKEKNDYNNIVVISFLNKGADIAHVKNYEYQTLIEMKIFLQLNEYGLFIDNTDDDSEREQIDKSFTIIYTSLIIGSNK